MGRHVAGYVGFSLVSCCCDVLHAWCLVGVKENLGVRLEDGSFFPTKGDGTSAIKNK